MESRSIFFDPSATCHGGNLMFLGNSNPIFQGQRPMISMEETSKRRPFFTSPEDFYEDENYDEQQPEKKRRLTPEQLNLLEKSFEAENKLEPEQKTQLAKKLGLQPRQVAVWFQNRRARWKTKQLERDFDLLKASYDSLVSDYDSVLKENEKLKSEVVSLTEKLQTKEMVTTAPPSGQRPSTVSGDAANATVVAELKVKVEDRVSTGSTGSAVVDEDSPQLVVDSGDSYFPDDNYGGCGAVVSVANGRIGAEDDDDGGDGCRSYFSHHLFAAVAEQEQHVQGETLGWWVWS